MNREDVVYICVHLPMECYSAIEKEQNNAICSNVDEPGDHHTKWSKSDRERQIYDIIYTLSLKKIGTNEFYYKTEVES